MKLLQRDEAGVVLIQLLPEVLGVAVEADLGCPSSGLQTRRQQNCLQASGWPLFSCRVKNVSDTLWVKTFSVLTVLSVPRPADLPQGLEELPAREAPVPILVQEPPRHDLEKHGERVKKTLLDSM